MVCKRINFSGSLQYFFSYLFFLIYIFSTDYGLLNVSGEEAYRKLLNLGTGATLAFVIDETGSMRDEILAVKEEAIEIVRETNGTYDAPYNYVVVPFSDPGKYLRGLVCVKISYLVDVCFRVCLFCSV